MNMEIEDVKTLISSRITELGSDPLKNKVAIDELNTLLNRIAEVEAKETSEAAKETGETTTA